MFSREQMQRAIEDALRQMEGIALELYRRGREPLLEELKTMKRERDEARAACPDCAMWAERSARWHDDMQRAERERDEARAEVEHAYREGGALYEAKIAEREAFRSGAEAMREACAQWVDHWASEVLAEKMRALPIPEEQ